MVRAGSGKTLMRRRKRTRKLTKGFRLSRHNLYRQSIVTLIRARKFAFRDRRRKKREFRRLWIIRINAACRSRGFRYSLLICGLQNANVILDRKSLSEIAIHDPEAFTQLVELAKKHLPKGLS
ncbi:50S ribosomal protein L20 [Telmatocola sphagniphila]|jgi:large subunit ribosomal protein L20|uniref:Large ribosomal subunit protein bL20 n=1 Tax=Telmatocola sphagniphila TaxID=1123043 RepID=A0A8E6EWZ2_9BACT|nr:50S ribosomal protein L20 [Telmatocola sphagniphila]QVL34510.1 50S ribosomal protein L20 [Telmatocola sphagniphila]